MKKIISLLSALTSVILCFTFSVSAKENKFTDVPEGSWYYNAVYYCVSKNIFSGTSATAFSPKSELTRAMAVTVLSAMDNFDKTKYSGNTAFSDVPSGKWYSAAIKWASDNNIVAGYSDKTFKPNQSVTREQFILMLYAYKTYKGNTCSARCTDIDKRFADSASIHTWSKTALSWAVAQGIVSGTNEGKINPQGVLTRAEASVMCYRAADKLLCVYYDGLWNVGFSMEEADIKSSDIVYYLSLYIKNNADIELSNSVLTANDISVAKKINPELKILLTLVGDNRAGKNGADQFANAVMTPANRTQLVNKITGIVKDYGFDGVDINWEYPRNKYDKENEVLFAKELRAALYENNPEAMLTAAVPATMYGFETHDITGLLPYVDYFNVMTYDFHINDDETLHHTPTYNDATGKYADRGYSCAKTVEIFTNQGVPSNKIIIGCGLYTLGWKNVEKGSTDGYNRPGTRVRNQTYHYNELYALTKAGIFKRYWDSTACAAYWYNNKTGIFLSSDDDESVRAKSKLCYDTYTSGLMMFSYYTFRGGTLLQSAEQWLSGYYDYPASLDWSILN